MNRTQPLRGFDLFGAFPVFLPQANEGDRLDIRLKSALGAFSAVCASDGEVLLLFPAGYLRSETSEEQTVIVEAMANEARRYRVHLIFGIDIVSGKERSTLATPVEAAYLYQPDRNLLMELSRIESDRMKSSHALPKERSFQIGPLKISLLFAGEIFYSSIQRNLAKGRPNLIIVLSPSGITRRWRPALEKLERVAPTLTFPRFAAPRKGYEAPPPCGWHKELYGATANLLLFRWFPEPD